MNQQSGIPAGASIPAENTDPFRLIGKVIWDIVARDSKPGRRTLYLLDGLPGSVLTALSELGAEGYFSGGSYRLAIDARIDGLDIALMNEDDVQDVSPVRVRNEDFAGPVLMAACESERRNARASLNTTTVIEAASIAVETDIWVDILFGIGGRTRAPDLERWVRAMIDGMAESGFGAHLDRFAAVISEVAAQRHKPARSAFLDAIHHLRLPRGSVEGIPAPEGRKVTARTFADALSEAKQVAGNAPMLFDKDGRRYDLAAVRRTIESARVDDKSASKGLTPAILDAAEALVDDAIQISEATWRPSQAAFCKEFDWNVADLVLSSRKRPPAPKLHEKVMKLMRDEGRDAEIEQLKDAFEKFASGTVEERSKAAALIFEDQGEWMIGNDPKLAKSLRAFAKADLIICETDLSAGLLQAYQKLMAVATEEVIKADEKGADWSVTLTAPRKDVSSSWANLAPAVYEAFLLEMAFASQVFAGHFYVDLGKWRDAAPDPKKKPKEKVVDLQLELRIAGEERAAEEKKVAHIVRLDWTPNERSVAVAMPADLRQLYQNFTSNSLVRVWPASAIVSTNTTADAVSLTDIDSFDVTPGDGSGTVAKAAGEHDVFARVTGAIEEERAGTSITPDEVDGALRALNAFRMDFSSLIETMQGLGATPIDLGLIDRAAVSYGALCRAVAPFARTERSRDAVIVPICEFGLVKLQDEEAAILPGWHPVRLFERRVKFARIAQIANEIHRDRGNTDGHETEAERMRAVADEHRLPEALVVGGTAYQIVDSLMGYGLAVSERHEDTNRTALDGSADLASSTFLSVVDDYLDLNPHEEANLSTAIYGAESTRLPRLLTDGIEGRMKSNRDLRCELFITHDRKEQLRDIYAVQNAILKERGTGGDGGFLSRLRVGVLPTEGREGREHDRADIDVVLLHDAHQGISRINWELEIGSADAMPKTADLDDWFAPRVPEFEEDQGEGRRLTMALGVSRPPRLFGHYMNLFYLARRGNTNVPVDKHASPVRTARWSVSDSRAGQIGHIVKRAHDLGEWVVSVDRMSTRAMLQSFGIEVIRDIPARHSDHRILVSASQPSEALRRRITQRFQLFHGLPLLNQASDQAGAVISTVVRVAGQKLLGANRSTNSANEVIGLAVAAKVVEGAISSADPAKTPVWISLDEAGPALQLPGKIADAIALTVDMKGARPKLNMIVVEAKCVETAGLSEQAKGSREQTINSVNRLAEHFSSNDDAADKRCRCRDILHLIASKPEFRSALSCREERTQFVEAMLRGDVDVDLRGLSVVSAHDANDDQISQAKLDFSAEATVPCLQIILSKRILSELLTEGVTPFDLTEHFKWADMLPTVSSDGRPEKKSAGLTGADTEISPDQAQADPEPSSDEPEADGVQAGAEIAEEANIPDQCATPLPAFSKAVATFIAEAARRPQARQDAESVSAEASETAKAIQSALTQYGMEAQFHDEPFTITPNGTLVRFKGHRTLTEKSVRAKLSELQTTHGIEVAYLRPGKGWLGLFVPAERRRTVHLANLWAEANWPASAPESNASILIGAREDDGRPIWLNLAADHDGQPEHMPHTLIAGETGSGKGNLLQSILLQLAATNDPRNMKIKLIDPKQGADFFWLDPVPHMDGDIVATPEDAVATMKELVAEMDRRYELIVEARTRTIDGYNRKVPEPDRLPRIVVAHDEMASWMQGNEDYRKSVESALTDLASKSRAAGLHIILVTQRASQEAIPPSVRENMGNRLCLKVASDKGSNLALGAVGAENLLGKGHLAAGLPGDTPPGSEFHIVQVPFISEDDLARLGELIGQNGPGS